MGKKIAVDGVMLRRLLASYESLASLAEIVPEGCDQEDLPEAERGHENEYHRVDDLAMKAVAKDVKKAIDAQEREKQRLKRKLAKLEQKALNQAVDDVADAAGVGADRALQVVEACDLEELPEADESGGANFSYGYWFGVRDVRRELGL